MHISALAFIFSLLKYSRNVKRRCNLIKLSRVIDTNFVLIEAYTIQLESCTGCKSINVVFTISINANF